MKKVTLLTTVLFFISTIATAGNLLRVQGRVTKVYDGDTIKVKLNSGKKIKVRFLGVDTPESYRRRFGYVEFYGKQASHFIKRLLRHRIVTLYVPRGKRGGLSRGRYGRVLAFVHQGGRDICALLLKKGLAQVYRKKKSPRHYRYLQYERIARSAKIGIWNSYKKRNYYRSLFNRTKNDKLILEFWRNDRPFLRQLLNRY